MAGTRWINQSLARTLYMASILLYLDAAFAAFRALALAAAPSLIGAAISLGLGWGITNEKKVVWWIASILYGIYVGVLGIIVVRNLGLVFDLDFLLLAVWPVAIFLLLVHPESRGYQKIWFK